MVEGLGKMKAAKVPEVVKKGRGQFLMKEMDDGRTDYSPPLLRSRRIGAELERERATLSGHLNP